uniref:Inhibitor I9 domain-containing protein n=1 Tax=Setaria viridis TaxID=4556 RepID=A0A4U6UQ98_SETVI|nr:hypothetical protein SEVIR_5G351566v2 [Setaria viridis]
MAPMSKTTLKSMGFYSSWRASASSALLLLFFVLLLGVHGGSRRLYIVYLGDVKHGHPEDVIASHHDLLSDVLGSKEDSLASVVHNYKHGFSGFAAMLTEDQAKQLAEFPEVISVEPSRSYTATTTRSWDFLGLSYQMPSELLQKKQIWRGHNYRGCRQWYLARVEKLQRRRVRTRATTVERHVPNRRGLGQQQL